MLRRQRGITGRSGYCSADRRRAEIDALENFSSLGESFDFFADGRSPAVELASERHRHRVLEMGAAHLEHVLELQRLGEESLLELPQCLHVTLEPEDQAKVKGRRIDVVRGLAALDVIV